jgi:hypothetical protein
MTARAVVMALCLWSGAALAESSVLAVHALDSAESFAAGWVGMHTLGLGVSWVDSLPVVGDSTPDAIDRRRAAWAAELAWAPSDATVELRGARAWQLRAPSFATPMAELGLAAILVPAVGVPDVGVGPHAGLSVRLGGETFAVNLGLDAGAELFAGTGGPRFPLRALAGLTVHAGRLTVTLHARGGVDLEWSRSTLYRGDVLLGVGWAAFRPAS